MALDMNSSVNGSRTVCVTGAGGFIGSWIVKDLLHRGYSVRGTLRNPEDPKNSHLKQLEGAPNRLTLCKADVLDYASICEAVRGCKGVFHVASPVADVQAVVRVAVDGTKNVIRASADMGIHRIVVTSSYGAVHMNPNRGPDTIVDESCWSDPDFCVETNNWYCYGKMKAEQAAAEEALARGIQLLVVVPTVTLGPMLQSTLNASVYSVLRYITGERKLHPNAVAAYTDVRDVSLAHILLYENPNASGRYLCIESVLHRSDFIKLLAEILPEFQIMARCEDVINPKVKPYRFSNKKLKDIGLEFTPLRKCLQDMARSLNEKGYFNLPKEI